MDTYKHIGIDVLSESEVPSYMTSDLLSNMSKVFALYINLVIGLGTGKFLVSDWP